MEYVLTNRKSRQTSLPAKRGNLVFDDVLGLWDKFLILEIEALALDAYLKHMVIWSITYTTPPPKNPTLKTKKHPNTKNSNPKEFLTVTCLEKRYSFFF